MLILNDINLSEIIFSHDGRDLTFKFINMSNGLLDSLIKCKSVYIFNYNNSFENGDGFACYVGEVTCEKIPFERVSKWLTENRFSFTKIDRSVFLPTSKDLYNLHIEGGEIVVDLTCELIEKDGVILQFI